MRNVVTAAIVASVATCCGPREGTTKDVETCMDQRASKLLSPVGKKAVRDDCASRLATPLRREILAATDVGLLIDGDTVDEAATLFLRAKVSAQTAEYVITSFRLSLVVRGLEIPSAVSAEGPMTTSEFVTENYRMNVLVAPPPYWTISKAWMEPGTSMPFRGTASGPSTALQVLLLRERDKRMPNREVVLTFEKENSPLKINFDPAEVRCSRQRTTNCWDAEVSDVRGVRLTAAD